MLIFPHNELPIHSVPRIKTRVLIERGASATALWEQWIEPDGYIPLHYHDVEEVLLFLHGKLTLTTAGATTTVHSPATVVIPANQIHGMRPCGATTVHLLACFPTSSPKIYATDGSLRPMPWEDRDGGERPP